MVSNETKHKSMGIYRIMFSSETKHNIFQKNFTEEEKMKSQKKKRIIAWIIVIAMALSIVGSIVMGVMAGV